MRTKIFLATVVCSSISFLSFANSPQPRPFEKMTSTECSVVRTEKMDKMLNLNDEQKAKMEKLFQKEAEKMKKYNEECNEFREKMAKKRKDLKDNSDKELKKILTEEQYQKYKDFENRHPRCHKQGEKPCMKNFPPQHGQKKIHHKKHHKRHGGKAAELPVEPKPEVTTEAQPDIVK